MEFQLQVQDRTVFGKKTNSLKKDGVVPTVLYGHGITNRHFSVLEKELVKIYRQAGESAVVNLVDEKKTIIPVLISHLERDPLTQKIIHVDFHQIRMDEKIKLNVPIHFVGEAPAIKNGLILVKVSSEVEVEALPNHIPQSLEVDLSRLENIHDSVHIKDLKLPAEVKLVSDPEGVVVTINAPAKEEVVAPPPEAAPAEGTETGTVATASEGETAPGETKSE